MNLGEIEALERRLRSAVIALNKRKVAGLTLVEVVDDAEVWPGAFEAQQPFLSGQTVSLMLTRAPLFMCAVASEIGFRFEGIGTEYWNKLSVALGTPITMLERTLYQTCFSALADKYALSRPSESAFSAHFSIMSWPIANALLPLDLVGPVTRLLNGAPAAALPGPGRETNFASLRGWASAAEGARLVDWLRIEAASDRVLTALLNENRAGGISPASYARLSDAIVRSSEAFFAVRAARVRQRRIKIAAPSQQSLGRLTVLRTPNGLKLFASWPALPADLADEAKILARAAGWRPQLWAAGACLHSDTALGEGPFALTHQAIPRADRAAYGDASAIFGAGSAIAAALAGRTIDWTENLLFEVNQESSRAEQRFTPFDALVGTAWVATSAQLTALEKLRSLGTIAGYRVFEADLASEADRAILAKESLFAAANRKLVARHPVDAISAPQGVVRPGRPFVVYCPGPPIAVDQPQRLSAGDRLGAAGIAGQPRLVCEAAAESEPATLTLSLLERDTAFAALIERRLQLRLESAHALTDVPVTVELEIDGRLIVRSTALAGDLPATIGADAPLFATLYADWVRRLLLERGSGQLRFSVGRLASILIPVARPQGSVDWSASPPQLIDAQADAELVCAPAAKPHRFASAEAVGTPASGALGYAFRYSDGRLAEPMNLLAASNFNLGDLGATFGPDLGSRRLHDGGRGTGDLARARVAWARAQCASLQALAAKTRVVQQFEPPLVYNLCGRDWADRERNHRLTSGNPRECLYHVALEQGLASLPEGAERFASEFASAFALRAQAADPDWPLARKAPLDGAFDDALNLGFTDAVTALQSRDLLKDVDCDDCDFGSPEEAWAGAADEALQRIRRTRLAALIAPSEGGRQLLERFYGDVGIAEMAEDLAAWTRAFALPRGQLTSELAAAALQLWLSPAACDALDASLRVLANDPFVARATRYAALRMHILAGATA